MSRPVVFILLLALACRAPALSAEKVDLELILMADGSGSVDDQEFTLQRQGYARALRHPRVIGAIRSGPLGAIALSYVEWSGPFLQVPIVPWRVIRGKDDMEAFAGLLESRPRELYRGGTAIGDAILYGARALRENGFEGRRLIVDISGDGPDRYGMPAAIGRDQAVKMGVTVNGLPILGSFFALNRFFIDNVIGGPGAFSIPARDFKDFATAIRVKLIREIAGRSEGQTMHAAKEIP